MARVAAYTIFCLTWKRWTHTGRWIQTSAAHADGEKYRSCSYTYCSYRRLVRRPGQEDPLVSLSVSGVQAVEDVAGFLRREQRKQKRIVIFVPALLWFSVPVQHQLLCRQKHTGVTSGQRHTPLKPRPLFLYRSWWQSSLSWSHPLSSEPGSLWVQVLLELPDIKQKSQNWGWGSGDDGENARAGSKNLSLHFRETIWSTAR